MAMTGSLTYQFLLEAVRKEHDIESDTLKAVLLNEGFEFDPATHVTYSDIEDNEIDPGTGYTAGGQVLAGVAAAFVAATSEVAAHILISCNSPSWAVSGGNLGIIRAACIVNTSHANNTVICGIDLDGLYIAPSGENFVLNFSDGLISFTPATGGA